MKAGKFSFGEFVWWQGVVENRVDDPEKLGRVRVRIFGYHSKDLGDIPSDHLMWAVVSQPITSAAISGIGTSPTGILEGTHVFGWFADGENAQVPIVMGTYAGKPEESNSGEGFGDPNGKYPRYPLGESDVNRLAKVEKISETIVQKKRDSIDESRQAFRTSQSAWREKATPYNARYPYNHVRESESGHIEEFDDTEGSERYGLWHRTGTFREIHPDGDMVEKIVKDRYTVVLHDDYAHVIGNTRVTTTGNSWVRVEGDAFLEVDGDLKQYVHGDYDLRVGGNMKTWVEGSHHELAGVHRVMVSPRIDLNPPSGLRGNAGFGSNDGGSSLG